MPADGRHSRQQHTKDGPRRRGDRLRRGRWLVRRVMISLPGCQQRTLAEIEQTLVVADPGLDIPRL